MVEFIYNKTKNMNTSPMLFKFHYGYYSCFFFEDNTDPCLRFCSAKKRVKKLKDLMFIY